MRYLMTLLVIVGLGLAYLPSSFRNLSTAYLFEDDYDLIFDPARIPLIEGSRLYTNLSNLVTADEETFGQSTANFYMLGGSTKIGKFYPAVLYDHFAWKDPLWTGLRGQNNDSLYGEGEVTNIIWRDLDSNGTYDYKSVDSRWAQSWQDTSDMDFLIGFGKNMGEDKRIGLSYAFTSYQIKHINPDSNHVYDQNDSNLISGLYTFSRYDSAEGLSKTKGVYHNIHLSGWMDKEKWSAGIGVRFIPHSYTTERNYFDTLYENRSPSDTAIVDYYMKKVDAVSMRPYSGFIVPVTLKLFYNWNEKTQSRIYLTYGMGMTDLSDDAGGHEYIYKDTLYRPGQMIVNDTVQHFYTGERNDNWISLMTQHFFNVSERFDLAFGLGFSNSTPVDELIDSAVTYRTTTFNHGDTLPDHDDYTAVTTGSEQWKTRTTGVVRTFTLPVGLEFKIFNPLVLRLGAEHTVTFSDSTTTDDLLRFVPQKIKTTYGDGVIEERMGTNQTRRPSTETEKETTHETEYCYGLGWAATDNLQIDLMGFARLTDLTNWKLSVTFKF